MMDFLILNSDSAAEFVSGLFRVLDLLPIQLSACLTMETHRWVRQSAMINCEI